MEQITVSQAEARPMEAIAPGVQGLRIAFVNVFGLSHADASWILVDAGLPFSAGLIRRWAEKQFTVPPNAILLTHGHFDHVSAARELADEWNVPVYSHPLEAPYLTGKQNYPPPDTDAGGGLMTLLSPMYPRGPIDLGGRLRPLTFQNGVATISEASGWQILHTPGHTPGHISLFRPSDRTLLAGDAFCTTKPESFFEAALAQEPELHGPPSYFTSDWNAARQSVQLLAGLQPLIVAPGHGKPLAGADVPNALKRLAASFDEVAAPKKD